MKKILSFMLFVFYVAIVVYVLLYVLKIDTAKNFVTAMVFEGIGWILLFGFVFVNLVKENIKVGYFVPLLCTTIIYTVLLNVVNMALVTTVSSTFFVLINLILLFVYCLVSIPMYLMGRR